MKIINCLRCGKEFEQKTKSLCCSAKCASYINQKTYRARRAARGLGKKPTTLVCQYCEQEFTKKGGMLRFCSKECKEAHEMAMHIKNIPVIPKPERIKFWTDKLGECWKSDTQKMIESYKSKYLKGA